MLHMEFFVDHELFVTLNASVSPSSFIFLLLHVYLPLCFLYTEIAMHRAYWSDNMSDLSNDEICWDFTTSTLFYVLLS